MNLIDADKLYDDVLDWRCKMCFYRSFRNCRIVDQCMVSTFLAMIDGDRWLRERNETVKRVSQICPEEKEDG